MSCPIFDIMKYFLIFFLLLIGLSVQAQYDLYFNEILKVDSLEEHVIASFETVEDYYFVLSSETYLQANATQSEGVIIGTLDKTSLTPTIRRHLSFPVDNESVKASYQDSVILIVHEQESAQSPYTYSVTMAYHLRDTILWTSNIVDTSSSISPRQVFAANNNWLLVYNRQVPGQAGRDRMARISTTGQFTDITPSSVDSTMRLSQIVTDTQGHFYIAGTKTLSNNNRQVFLQAIDENQAYLWQQEWGGSGPDVAGPLACYADELFFVFSYCEVSTGSTNCQFTPRAISIDKNGIIIDTVNYRLPDNWHSFIPSGLIVDSAFTMLAGSGWVNGSREDGMIMKTDLQGNVEWARHYWYEPHFSQSEKIYQVFYSDSAIITIGDIPLRSDGMGALSLTYSPDAWLMRLDSIGCRFSKCDSVCYKWDSIIYDLSYKGSNTYELAFQLDSGIVMNSRVLVEKLDMSTGFFSRSFTNENTMLFNYGGGEPLLVEIKAITLCGNISVRDTFYIPVGVMGPDSKSNGIAVYPNPASKQLYIEGPSSDGILIIYRADGSIAFQQNQVGQQNMISVEKWASGLYWVQWTNEDIVSVEPLVILNR